MSTSPLKQSINLFQKEKGPDIPLSFFQISRILGGVLIFLGLILIIDGFQYWYGARKMAKIETQKVELQHKIKNLEVKIQLSQSKETLVKEVKQLELEQKFDIEKLKILRDIQYTESGGFSKFFIAMANEIPEDLWLTRFMFSKNGSYISLEGKALHPKYIPQLIAGLGKEASFSGKTFQVFKVEVDPKTSQVNFLLQSAGGIKR